MSIRQLARRLKIPHHFLAEILQRLTQKALLTSTKGPGGGFALGIPSKNITLSHVVDAVDSVGFANRCLLGFPECQVYIRAPSTKSGRVFATPYTTSW